MQIDDVNIGDDGEDSTNEEDEGETSSCLVEPFTDTEKEDSTLDDQEDRNGDEGGDGDSEDGGGEIFCLLIFISLKGWR